MVNLLGVKISSSMYNVEANISEARRGTDRPSSPNITPLIAVNGPHTSVNAMAYPVVDIATIAAAIPILEGKVKRYE